MDSELRPALLVILLRSSEKWGWEGSRHLTGLDQQMHKSFLGQMRRISYLLFENKY